MECPTGDVCTIIGCRNDDGCSSFRSARRDYGIRTRSSAKPGPERKQREFKIEFRGADGELLVASPFNGAALPL